MEAGEDQQFQSDHYFSLFEGNSSLSNNLDSMFLQNPHDEDHFHVHDQYHHHDQPSPVVMDQEKRLRKMEYNRESARRSRMRVKKKIEGLKMEVEQLKASYQFLSNKYVSLLEYNTQILHEMSQLKATLSSFPEDINDLI